MNYSIKILAILCMLALLGAGCFGNDRSLDRPGVPDRGQDRSDDQTDGTNGENQEEPEPVEREWTTYVNDAFGFSMSYPVDMTVSDQGTRISFSVWGPTQKEGTELFDGIAFAVTKLTIAEGQTFETAARADFRAEGSENITESLHEVSFDHVSGLEGEVEGLGAWKYIYVVGSDARTMLRITVTAPDPGQRGFADAVKTMLNSLRVLVDDLIQVSTPKAHTIVSSPLTITGQARGTWYFEASFPVEIYDANGVLLGTGHAQAQGDWMTEDWVAFEATLSFDAPTTRTGMLVLKKDNPSGLAYYDKSLEIPVRFE